MKKKVMEFAKKNKIVSIIIVFLILIGLGGLVIYLTKTPEKKKKSSAKKRQPVKKPAPKARLDTATTTEKIEVAPAANTSTTTTVQAGPVGFGQGGGGGSGGASYDRSAENATNAAKYKSKRASQESCQRRTGGRCVEKGDSGQFFDPVSEANSLISLEDAMVKAHNDARSSCGGSEGDFEWDDELAKKAGECFIPDNDNCRETNVSIYDSINNSSGKSYNTSDNFSELAVNSWKNFDSNTKQHKRLFSNLIEDGLFGCAQQIPDLDDEGETDEAIIIRCLYDNYDTELDFEDEKISC